MESQILKISAIQIQVLALTGCMRVGLYQGGQSDITSVIAGELNLKYDDSFTVQSFERNNAIMAFNSDTYAATVLSDNYGETFQARIDTDGQNLVDNYPKVVWGSEIEQKLNNVEQSLANFNDLECKTIYHLQDSDYVTNGTLDSYLTSGDVYIDVEVTLPQDLDSAYESLNEIRHTFQNEGLQYQLGCQCGNEYIVIAEYGDLGYFSDQEVYEKLANKL